MPDQIIGVIGGTGPQGRGLAFRFAQAGLSVLIGSREAERAAAVAADIAGAVGEPLSENVRGFANPDVASRADITIVAVPWNAHAATLETLRADLAGKIVVDCVNPISVDRRGAYGISVTEGSAAEQAATLLPESTVVAAFHHISAVLLNDPDVSTVDCDVLILGNDQSVVDTVGELAELIPGVRGVAAGGLRNASAVEALTANLIAINRRHRTHAGIRITGI